MLDALRKLSHEGSESATRDACKPWGSESDERPDKPRRPAARLDNDLPCVLSGWAHAQSRASEGVSMSHVNLHLRLGRVRGRQSFADDDGADSYRPSSQPLAPHPTVQAERQTTRVPRVVDDQIDIHTALLDDNKAQPQRIIIVGEQLRPHGGGLGLHPPRRLKFALAAAEPLIDGGLTLATCRTESGELGSFVVRERRSNGHNGNNLVSRPRLGMVPLDQSKASSALARALQDDASVFELQLAPTVDELRHDRRDRPMVDRFDDRLAAHPHSPESIPTSIRGARLAEATIPMPRALGARCTDGASKTTESKPGGFSRPVCVATRSRYRDTERRR